ncbi:MAG: Dabb family protein [Actinomycetales bacterium]|nr:Dabb family protein [Actinomycetales bacterium]
MIVHSILFRFAGDTPDERRRLAEDFRDRLASLEDRIDQVRSMSFSFDLGRIEDHFDLALTSIHDSEADLEAYQAHPLHQEAAAYGRTIIVARACVDSEVPDRAD